MTTHDSSASTPLPDIRQTAILSAPISDVWRLASTADGLASWFMKSDLLSVEGHVFHLEAGPFGKSPCKVTEVQPPNRLAFQWGKDWLLTFELEENPEEKTSFTLIHSGWREGEVTEFGQSHAEVRERMAGGWSGIMAKLVQVAEGL